MFQHRLRWMWILLVCGLVGCGASRSRDDDSEDEDFVQESQKPTASTVSTGDLPPHVVRTNDGRLWPAPGYGWVSNQPGDNRVRWTPGAAHPQNPNIMASEVEGKWIDLLATAPTQPPSGNSFDPFDVLGRLHRRYENDMAEIDGKPLPHPGEGGLDNSGMSDYLWKHKQLADKLYDLNTPPEEVERIGRQIQSELGRTAPILNGMAIGDRITQSARRFQQGVVDRNQYMSELRGLHEVLINADAAINDPRRPENE